MMPRFIRLAALCAALLLAAPIAASAQDAKLMEAQKILLLLSLSQERPTGLPTPKSTQLLQQFQKQHNLSATGTVDDATLEALRTARDTTLGHSLVAPPALTPQQRAKLAEPAAPPPAMPIEHLGSEALGGTSTAPGEGRSSAGSGLPPSIAKPFTSKSDLVGPTVGPQEDAPRAPHQVEEAYWTSDVPIWVWAAMAAGAALVIWGLIRRMTAPLNKRAWFDDPEPATPLDRREPIVK
jgi:hypothetical protein